MANWTEPVYDRTLYDVESAIRQLNDGVNKVAYKGCFNSSDANRIEENAQYISDVLKELYYFNDITTKTNWNKSSFLNKSSVDRLISNVGALLIAYHTPLGSPSLPTTLTHYEHANAIEKNIHLLKVMIDEMVGFFRECDDGLECEEDI